MFMYAGEILIFFFGVVVLAASVITAARPDLADMVLTTKKKNSIMDEILDSRDVIFDYREGIKATFVIGDKGRDDRYPTAMVTGDSMFVERIMRPNLCWLDTDRLITPGAYIVGKRNFILSSKRKKIIELVKFSEL